MSDLPAPQETAAPAAAPPTRAQQLRGHLADELSSLVERAEAAARAVAQAPEAAVHDYRKALRRTRAVVAMLAESVRPRIHAAATQAVRDARRQVSGARDHAVVPAVLAQAELAPELRAVAEAILVDARAARPLTEDLTLVVAEGAAAARAQIDAFTEALPGKIRGKALRRSIAENYAAARKALAKSKHSDRAFHRFRRRSKELSHQLDLLATQAGPHVVALRDRFTALSDQLGEVVDLVMLRGYLAQHGQRQSADLLAQLLIALDDRAASRIADARALGKDVFGARKRKFRRALRRAVKQDTQPAEPAAAAPEADAEDGA